MYKVIHTLEVREICDTRVSPRVDRVISRTFRFDGLLIKVHTVAESGQGTNDFPSWPPGNCARALHLSWLL